MIRSVRECDLNFIAFSVMNGVLRLKWLSSFVMLKNSFWFTIPDAVFLKMGGIDLLLPLCVIMTYVKCL